MPNPFSFTALQITWQADKKIYTSYSSACYFVSQINL